MDSTYFIEAKMLDGPWVKVLAYSHVDPQKAARAARRVAGSLEMASNFLLAVRVVDENGKGVSLR